MPSWIRSVTTSLRICALTGSKPLKEKCEEYFGDIIRVDEVMKEFVILELKESRSKNDLLSEIIKSDIDVEKFGEYEPSLNDIFVLKAGDE